MYKVRVVNTKIFRQGCYVVDARFILKIRLILTNFMKSYIGIKEHSHLQITH